MRRDIKSMSRFELSDFFYSIGEKKFRANQVFSWLHKGVRSFDEMTNIDVNLRAKLNEMFFISKPIRRSKLVSDSDETVKYLWEVNNGDVIESVVMKYKHGYAACISSQVGCKMGCLFCASTDSRFVRNLQPSEMLDQILYSQLDLDIGISNITIMGVGEPLDNFDNLARFLVIVNDPSGINIGARKITVSTVGLIEFIDKLAQIDIQLTLAISLHAPDDETRNIIIPANTNIGVSNLIQAAGRYFDKTGRRVTYEYALIDGINDLPHHAQSLAELIKSDKSHLNIIPLSPVPDSDFIPSDAVSQRKFIDVLKRNNVNYTQRRSLGTDINAACGQLRNSVSSVNISDISRAFNEGGRK